MLLKATMFSQNVSHVNPNTHTHTHTCTCSTSVPVHNLSTPPPSSFTCCVSAPLAVPLCLLPLNPQPQMRALALHTLHTNASARPGASETNRAYETLSHTHKHTDISVLATCALTLLYFPRLHISQNTASVAVFVHETPGSGHSSHMSPAANHSVNRSFITVIVISKPPASRLHNAEEQEGRLILKQRSDQISFKSHFQLQIFRQRFPKSLGAGGVKSF